MFRYSKFLFCLALIMVFAFNIMASCVLAADGGETVIRTEIFKFNPKNKKIEYSSEKVLEFLNLNFISVTADQPEYWPNEDVSVKIMMPAAPAREVKITLQKKDSIAKVLGNFKLDDGGLLVQKIMSGKETRLEPGEYTVTAERTDKKIQEFTTFSVVAGSLSAVSFAYEFKQMTSFDALRDARGGWFLGNAGGSGMRWGNKLFVKNQLRQFNEPLSGMAAVKTRCYLPGCNGCEAGPQQNIDIKNGSLETGFDIAGHSGPFEIEVTTAKGSIRHMFQKSGHVERQSTKLTHNMTNDFFATLAPYEGTTQVYGRDVFIEKSRNRNENDALELISPAGDETNKVGILAKKTVKNARAVVFYFGDDCELKTREIAISKKIKKGEKIEFECFPPYSFIAVGGWNEENSGFFESWAIVFARSRMSVEINAPEAGGPLSSIEIELACIDMRSGKGIPCHGIIEVFDNRVESKSPKEQLVSAVGDSYRSLSGYTSNWRDLTGYGDPDISGNLNMGRNDTGVNRSGRGPFSDVPKGHWAYGSLEGLARKKLPNDPNIKRYKNGKMMTRYEMALVIARLTDEKFNGADLAELDKLATEYVDELGLLGVKLNGINGVVTVMRNDVDAARADMDALKKGGLGKFKLSVQDRSRFENENAKSFKGSGLSYEQINNSKRTNKFRANMKANIDDNVTSFLSYPDAKVHDTAPQNKPDGGNKSTTETKDRKMYLGYIDIKNFGGERNSDNSGAGSKAVTIGKGFKIGSEADGAVIKKNYRGTNGAGDHKWKNVPAGAYYAPGTNSNAAVSQLDMEREEKMREDEYSEKILREAETEEMLPEIIRDGEKKVVFCGAVTTDKNGRAKLSVQLPSQTGRCKIRFVTSDRYDYLEKSKDIDVKKANCVETSIPSLLIPGARVTASVHVTVRPGEKMRLKISGACLEKEVSVEITEGKKDFEFELVGKNYGALHIEIFDSSDILVDRRDVNIKDPSSASVTYSNIMISNGSPISVKKGEKIEICSNPGIMLRGMVRNIVTTMYSWFAHAEAITAQAAIRAMLLRAIQEKMINDDGMGDILKADMVRSIRDLNEKFFDQKTGLIRPYPGMPVDVTWTIWSAKNLNSVIRTLKGSDILKNEFSEVIRVASEMLEKMISELLRRSVSIHELGMFDHKTGEDMIPVEIDGKVVYKVLTDGAVADWFVEKMIPGLDLPRSKNINDLSASFINHYDKYRFMKAFERTGSLYYILLNLRSLFVRNDKNFAPLFAIVARGLINTSEPRLIQGPALLGGVYSSPQTAVKFIELLVLMAGEKRVRSDATVEVKIGGETRQIVSLSDNSITLEASEGDMTIYAPEFSVVRSDETTAVNIFEHLEKPAFFKAGFDSDKINIGGEDKLTIQLDKEKDPSEYYAIIAVPSTLSVRQTEDLLSDYKGQLLYGQRSSGGSGMQFLTAPFRGSRTMTLNVEGVRKGESVGFVSVRHISNPDIIATVKTAPVKVK